MFEDMSAVASNDTAESPISTTLTAAALRATLPAIYSRDLKDSQLDFYSIALSDLFAIKDFANLYDLSQAVISEVNSRLYATTVSTPLLVFAEASKHDDLATAKQALSCFGDKYRVKDHHDIEQFRYATFAVCCQRSQALPLKVGPDTMCRTSKSDTFSSFYACVDRNNS
jgi:hypothetical protein